MDKTTPTATAAVDVGGEPKPGNVASLVKRISSELKSKCVVGADPSSRRSFADFRSRRLKVIAAHTPTSDEELRLEVNDILEFVGDDEDGRMRGRLNGKLGSFPSSCVKFVDPMAVSRMADSSSFVADQPSATSVVAAVESRGNGATVADRGDNSAIITATATTSVIQPKKVVGVGFGNIFAASDGKIGLKAARVGSVTEERSKMDDMPKPTATSIRKQEWLASSPVTTPIKEVRKELVRANYAYTAENDDELSFKAGDIISVLSKESEDPGWWLGELDGRRGVFPDNFVSAYSAAVDSHTKTQPPVVPMKPSKPCPPVPPPPSSPPLLPPVTDSAEDSTVVTPPSSSSSVTDRLDRLGAFRLPMFAKSKSAAKAAESTTAEPADATKPDLHLAKGDQLHTERGPVLSNDTAATDTDKLSHLTAERPKMKKRPPSQAFLKVMADSSQNGIPKTMTTTLTTTEIDGDSSAASSGHSVVPAELELLRRSLAEFKSKMLADFKELEKRFASVEASIVAKHRASLFD